MHAHKHTYTHPIPIYKHWMVYFGVMQQYKPKRTV